MSIGKGGGGRTWARTKDPLIKSQLLYQLSYASTYPTVGCWLPVVEARPSRGPSRSHLPPCGRIAQLVEQLTLNQRVLGSSPSASTIFWILPIRRVAAGEGLAALLAR